MQLLTIEHMVVVLFVNFLINDQVMDLSIVGFWCPYRLTIDRKVTLRLAYTMNPHENSYCLKVASILGSLMTCPFLKFMITTNYFLLVLKCFPSDWTIVNEDIIWWFTRIMIFFILSVHSCFLLEIHNGSIFQANKANVSSQNKGPS